jgi:hypothetical protein
MKRKLFYTVNYEVYCLGSQPYTTGYKTLKLYSIENGLPEIMAEIPDLHYSDKNEDFIECYLSDNGLGEESFEFIQL